MKCNYSCWLTVGALLYSKIIGGGTSLRKWLGTMSITEAHMESKSSAVNCSFATQHPVTYLPLEITYLLKHNVQYIRHSSAWLYNQTMYVVFSRLLKRVLVSTDNQSVLSQVLIVLNYVYSRAVCFLLINLLASHTGETGIVLSGVYLCVCLSAQN